MDVSSLVSLFSHVNPIVGFSVAVLSLALFYIHKVLSVTITGKSTANQIMKESRVLYQDAIGELVELRREMRVCVSECQKVALENKKLQYKIDLTIQELYRWTHDYPPNRTNITRLYEIVNNGKIKQ